VRKTLFALALCLFTAVLTGCMTTAPYGNFVNPRNADIDQQKIAADTVQHLMTWYLPAKTRFELRHPASDLFGQALVHGLRTKGYAVMEFDPKTKKTRSRSDVSSEDGAAPIYASGLPLRYVFDQAIDMSLYHITVMIDRHTFTRPYVQQDGQAIPAGYWSRQE